MSLKLTNDQQNAIQTFANFLVDPDERYMIIQGAAGCGKSTMIEYLIKSMDAQMAMYALLLKKSKRETEFGVKLTATTNKASAVLNDMSDYGATTIHSLLNLTVQPDIRDGSVKLKKKKEWALLYNQLIITDEASMVNDQLFEVLEESTVDCKVVLIGDKYQLAPVKQVTSIMDTLNCKYLVTMNKVMRHSGPIQHAAAQFRQTVEDGIWHNVPESPEVQKVDGNTFKQLIDDHFTDRKYTTDAAKVVAWTNRMVHAYNNHIRIIKGYPKELQTGETMFTNKPIMLGRMHIPTDSKVIVTEIGTQVTRENVPGRMVTLGRVEGFLPNDQEDAKAMSKYFAKQAKAAKKANKPAEASRNWAKYFMIKNDWLDLRQPFASTVHKAQGSTYDTVFIDLSDIGKCNIATDVARMLYVAISRASRQVYVYGELPPKYCEVT
jgi:GTPase SAR1 family protein